MLIVMPWSSCSQPCLNVEISLGVLQNTDACVSVRSLTGLGFAWVSGVLVASQVISDVKLTSVTSALGSLVEQANLFYLDRKSTRLNSSHWW